MHKAGVAALLRLLHRPVGGFHFLSDGTPVRGIEAQLSPVRRHHFLLLQQVVLPGVFDDGRHIGGHIAALIILRGDQRAAPPDTVNGVLLALQQHTKAVGALHLRRSGVNGGNGVILLLHVVIQQCRGDLGIGLG